MVLISSPYSIRLNREGTALRAGHHRLDPVMVSARRISEALVFLGSFSPLVDRFTLYLL